MSILHKIKNGKRNYKVIDFPGTDEKISIVVLSSQDTMDCKIRADKYISAEGIQDDMYKDITLQQHLAYEFLRDKDDQTKKVADTFKEFVAGVDNTELAYLITQYNLFTNENSPFLNSVTDEQLEALKKTLSPMKLSDLNGESLLALRNFLMSLV
jgi:hypothetical protein